MLVKETAQNKTVKMTEEKMFVDFKGKRFYAPFSCLCCGKEIRVEQFCFGRMCGYCDMGSCQSPRNFEIGHGRKDLFEQADDVPGIKKEENKKQIIDDQGIVYEEVSYEKYLQSKNKHRMLKSLEAQYFVEKNDKEVDHDIKN